MCPLHWEASGWGAGPLRLGWQTGQLALEQEAAKPGLAQVLGKVGKAVRRRLLAGWDVADSKGNAQLRGLSHPQPRRRRGRQPALSKDGKLALGFAAAREAWGNRACSGLELFLRLALGKPTRAIRRFRDGAGTGRDAETSLAHGAEVKPSLCSLAARGKKQRVLFQAPRRRWCCLT